MEIQHPIHKHPIVLYDLDREDLPCGTCGTPLELPKFHCRNCRVSLITFCLVCNVAKPISGPTYVCSRGCHYFIHQSCFDALLPAEIHHPFHPLHPLRRHLKNTYYDISEFECVACKGWTRGFVYQCFGGCDSFRICLPCVRMMNLDRLLTLKDGKHHMFLYENTTFERKCAACDRTDRDASIFICMVPDCDYAVHLHCSGLSFPEKIKSEYHIDVLTLTECVKEEGWDEYYCDACEYLRDPAHPVYHCDECSFAAHFGCALSEVLPSLIEDYENEAKAKGTFVDPWLTKLDEEIESLSAEEAEIRSKLMDARTNLKTLEDERDQFISYARRTAQKEHTFDPLRLHRR